MATALEVAQQRLTSYLAAETAILTAGQEGSVATTRRREADLAEIRRAITELQEQIADLMQPNVARIRIGVPNW